MRISVFVVIGAIACSQPAPTPAPAPPSTPKTAAPAEQSPEPAADRSACLGADLDLDRLALSHQCDVGGTAGGLPPLIEVALASPSMSATAGVPAANELVLTNQGSATARFRIDASCRFANLVDVEITTAHGARIDRTGARRCVEPREGCAGHVIEIGLEPGGVARIPFTVSTRIAVADSQTCEAHTGRPLAAGRYQATVMTPLSESPLESGLAIAAVKRLPVGACARYAKKLAALAEPDVERRAQVAAQVEARCRREPPPQSLVDCQLSAPDEAALAACAATVGGHQ